MTFRSALMAAGAIFAILLYPSHGAAQACWTCVGYDPNPSSTWCEGNSWEGGSVGCIDDGVGGSYCHLHGGDCTPCEDCLPGGGFLDETDHLGLAAAELQVLELREGHRVLLHCSGRILMRDLSPTAAEEYLRQSRKIEFAPDIGKAAS
jgi:hypothetical protein